MGDLRPLVRLGCKWVRRGQWPIHVRVVYPTRQRIRSHIFIFSFYLKHFQNKNNYKSRKRLHNCTQVNKTIVKLNLNVDKP
jgi:hypothetical protein